MNVTTINEFSRISGTCLQEQVVTSYKNLVKLFGQPNGNSDEYKTDAEWHLAIDGERVVTIYNWKNGKNYLGADGLPVEEIIRWNIGAHDYESASKLKTYILDEEA